MSDLTTRSHSIDPGSLAQFPEEVQEAHARFVATGDAAAADFVLTAVLIEHLPQASRPQDGLTLPEDARLMEDLGLDSLTIAEVVFFLEDLYRLRIPQEHLDRLLRVRDLRVYLRTRLESSAA